MNTVPLARILIVDDEAAQMRALCDTLRDQGYETAGFITGEEALDALQEKPFDLVLTDLMMPGMDGVALLTAALKIDPQLVGILMTGMGTIETAVQAMQAGALDYILKPFKVSAILPVLARALSVRRLRLENLELKNTVAIHELNQAIAYTLDPKVLLDKIADAALQQFEADEVSIMLLADDGRSFQVAAVRGEGRDALLGVRVPVGEGIAGRVAASREPLVLQGEVKDARIAPTHPRPEIQSALSMPMITRDRLIGVININCTRKRRAFAIGQIKVLTIFTNAAAAGIEAARLYEDERKAQARAALVGELERANRELKEMQAQLVQSAKMASLGQLVAGIAHEINNPVAFVTAHLQTVTRLCEQVAAEAGPTLSEGAAKKVEKIRQRLKDSGEGLERVSELVLKLRTFSRLDEGESKVASVRENVEAVLTMLRHRARNRIRIECRLGEPDRIACYPGLLNQALMNIVSNSIDAIEGEGKILITSGSDGADYEIAVEDTGRGIPAGARERIFEPFFTTKPVGKGTGLGMSITYQIVRRHGGSIVIESEEGRGTRIAMRLPLAHAAPIAAGN